MATDFSKVQAAREELDAALIVYAEKDKAHTDAIAAETAAQADLVTAQQAVTTAAAAKAEADEDAEAALATYLAELSAVGIDSGGSPPAQEKVKPKRKYTKRAK